MLHKLGYLERNYWKYRVLLYLLAVGFFVLAVFTFQASIKSVLRNWDNKMHLFGVMCLVFGFLLSRFLEGYEGIAIDRIGEIVRKMRTYKKGLDGENKVYAKLNKILDSKQYRIYRNYKIPGLNFDLDFVVTGPKGIVVLEVKNYANQLHFHPNYTEKIIPIRKNVKQVITLEGKRDPRNKFLGFCNQFKRHLQKNNLGNFSLKKVIVYVDDMVEWDRECKNGMYIVSGLNRLKGAFEKAYDDTNVSAEALDRLDEFLKKTEIS